MGFFVGSVLSSATAISPASTITAIQAGIPVNLTPISSQAGAAIAAVTAKGNSLATSINSISSTVNNLEKTVVGKATSYLQQALKSTTSLFGQNPTGLASTLDSALSSVFKNTTVKSATNTISQISDPIKTNLLAAKAPLATAFLISGIEAGSQTVGLSGATSSFGSKAEDMISTSLSTVLGRINLDSTANLGKTLTDIKTNAAISGLFSSVNSVAKLASTTAQLVGGSKELNVANDIQSFLGRTSNLQQALGGTDVSQYYMQSQDYSIVDQDGQPVYTNKSGVSSTTANALLEIARLVGCDVGIVNFNSASELASLFNTLLSLASQNGLSSIVNSLLGCSAAGGPLGQVAITNAFTSTAPTDAAIAKMLINKVDNKAALNTDLITQSLVTNPNLKSSSVGDVNLIMQSLGTTTQSAYQVQSIGSGTPVYNTSVLAASNPGFVETVFGDSTFTNFLNGVPVSLQSNGTFGI